MDDYPTGTPGPCSQFLVETVLLIYIYYFVSMIFIFFLCSVLCMSVLYVWSLSLDYILLIFARILFPLITLSNLLLLSNKSLIL